MANFRELVSHLFSFMCIYNGIQTSGASQYQWESKLHNDLMQTYHKAALPSEHGPVDVKLGFSLIGFDFFDESKELAAVHARLLKSWSDPRLKWDASAYNGTTQILVESKDLWVPDITMWNSGIVQETLKSDVLVYSTGNVIRMPNLDIRFICRMDFTLFPYDKQVCEIKFGSWHFSTEKVNLSSSSYADLTAYHHVGDFTLTELTADRNAIKYECCLETYADMTYRIHLERMSSAYSVKLVLPAALTGFLVLASFLLPPASQEKITLCGLLFMCLLLQLTYLHDVVPASGNSLMGDYLAFVLSIDFFATLIAVASYQIHNSTAQTRKKQSVMDDAEGDAGDFKVQLPKDRKQYLLRYLDYISFAVFSIVFIVGMAIILGRRG